MRWLIGFILFVALLVVGGYIFIKGYPYYLYSNWARGTNWNKYYYVQDYRSSLMAPINAEEIPPYKEDYGQLWREFPLRNTLVPLPVRHPLFQTIPIVHANSQKQLDKVGMIIASAQGRDLSSIITLPRTVHQDYSLGQELFKLPFVRNRILKISPDQMWKDIFSHTIKVESKSMDEMIYDLYLLHVRSKILPKETLRFGLIKNDQIALIELASPDKDYMLELVLTFDNGNIYSYVLKTEKNSKDSRKLRSKFLNSISFMPMDPAMGKILYTEFKQLNYARQVDQEGMLYLFSAWSQEVENVDLLREMIFYLERGKLNLRQLKTLHRYALAKYGKTFSNKSMADESDDPELTLRRKIEIEDQQRKRAFEKEKAKTPEAAELSPDEKMNLYLKKAKEQGSQKSDDMVIH